VPCDEIGDTGDKVLGEATGCEVARMSRDVTVIPDIETVRMWPLRGLLSGLVLLDGPHSALCCFGAPESVPYAISGIDRVKLECPGWTMTIFVSTAENSNLASKCSKRVANKDTPEGSDSMPTSSSGCE
jgi:hypothetical protein